MGNLETQTRQVQASMRALEGKVAVITGASKGIGASIAKHFAREGAHVVLNYASDKDRAGALVDSIKAAGGVAIAVQADVAIPQEISKLFQETEHAFGKLHILVNNAGVYKFASLDEITPEIFQMHFSVNVLGLLLVTKEAVRIMSKSGGSIINIGSNAGRSPALNNTIYSASKAAVDSITVSLAKELGPRNIRVNSLNPGMVETEGFRSAGFAESDWRKEAEKATLLGRIALPDEIARIATFLASDDSSWIHGETIFATGGRR
jgi:3-oxoacyl-[acyl-carrier protein] reductase